MIGLSKTTQSTENNASIVIKEMARSKIRDASARVLRAGTLDGGAVIEHLGFVDGDRQLDVFAQETETVSENLWNMFKNETFINISCIDGFFYGVIDRMVVDNGTIQIKLLIKE
jgi:hypothetical protein